MKTSTPTLNTPTNGRTQPAYDVVIEDGDFQVRDYDGYAIAETMVSPPFDVATRTGFGRLVRYISGANIGRRKIEMTAPVETEPRGEKIKMTAPVVLGPADHSGASTQFSIIAWTKPFLKLASTQARADMENSRSRRKPSALCSNARGSVPAQARPFTPPPITITSKSAIRPASVGGATANVPKQSSPNVRKIDFDGRVRGFGDERRVRPRTAARIALHALSDSIET